MGKAYWQWAPSGNDWLWLLVGYGCMILNRCIVYNASSLFLPYIRDRSVCSVAVSEVYGLLSWVCKDYYEQWVTDPVDQDMDINMLFHPDDNINMATGLSDILSSLFPLPSFLPTNNYSYLRFLAPSTYHTPPSFHCSQASPSTEGL